MPSATTAESSDSMRAEQREGDRVGQHRHDPFQRYRRQVWQRQRARQFAERAADGGDGKMQQRRDDGHADDGEKNARP